VLCKKHQSRNLAIHQLVSRQVSVAPGGDLRQIDCKQPLYAEVNFIKDVICKLWNFEYKCKRQRIPSKSAFNLASRLQDKAVFKGIFESDILCEIEYFRVFRLLDEFIWRNASHLCHASHLFIYKLLLRLGFTASTMLRPPFCVQICIKHVHHPLTLFELR